MEIGLLNGVVVPGLLGAEVEGGSGRGGHEDGQRGHSAGGRRVQRPAGPRRPRPGRARPRHHGPGRRWRQLARQIYKQASAT